jgi:TubC N-terminal docking domain
MTWYTALSLPRSVPSGPSGPSGPLQPVSNALAALWSLPVEVQTDGKSLRWRPADAVGPDLKRAIQANKAAIIATLTGSPAWDADRAAVALAECECAIDAMLTTVGLAAIQRSIAEVLRGVVRPHAERHDLLIFQDRDFLTEQFARWETANAVPAPRRKSA